LYLAVRHHLAEFRTNRGRSEYDQTLVGMHRAADSSRERERIRNDALTVGPAAVEIAEIDAVTLATPRAHLRPVLVQRAQGDRGLQTHPRARRREALRRCRPPRRRPATSSEESTRRTP